MRLLEASLFFLALNEYRHFMVITINTFVAIKSVDFAKQEYILDLVAILNFITLEKYMKVAFY